MSERSKASRSKRYLSPIGESDDEASDNAPNVLSDECMAKVDEGIKWVVDFCDKTMAENKHRQTSSGEYLKEDDSESDIHPAFRRNRTAGEAPLGSNGRAGATIIGPRPMKPKQRTHHDGHRHPEPNTEHPHSVKRNMSLQESRSIHEEGKAEFNKARSRSTGNRRRCGMTREVIGSLENVQRTLNPTPSRPLPPTQPSSSSASISRTAHTLPPLRHASPLTLVDHDDDACAHPGPLCRRLNQEREAHNYRTNEDAMRRLSCGETATTPPIPPPHRVSVRKKAGIPRPGEDADRRSSHSETLAPLRRPTHTEQEPRVSHANDDTVRRWRQQIRLVTEEDGA